MEKFLFLADSHGQLRDIETIEKAREFAIWFKPDWLIGGGDFWDLRCLRSGASDSEQNSTLKDDLVAAEDTFDRFFGSYASAKKVFLAGNHDHPRVERLLTHPKALVREFAANLIDDMDSVIKRFVGDSRPYNKRSGVLTVEGFNFLHGYSCGIHATRKHAISYGHCMFGHIHAFGVHTLEDMTQSTAYSVGCACDVDQEYNAAQMGTLRQENGFAYGFLDGARRIFDVHFARKVGDEYFLPTEWGKQL